MASWIGQYCINVTDLDETVAFYEALGLECTSRTEIDTAGEAIIEHPGKGGKLQLAQQKEQTGAIDPGNAFWKLYVNTNDIAATHAAALGDGGDRGHGPDAHGAVADQHQLRQGPRRLPGRARPAPSVARRRRHHARLAGPVLHQRHRPRHDGRLLRDARPRRAPAAPRSPGPRRRSSSTPTRGQGPARPAGRPGRAHRHGRRALEALRQHRRHRRGVRGRRWPPATPR